MKIITRIAKCYFLIVDCLRQDKLGATGYKPDLTPNLNKLYLNGLKQLNIILMVVLHSSFSLNFTSSLPLDYGGYNDGIKNRPISFPKHCLMKVMRLGALSPGTLVALILDMIEGLKPFKI